ncbi:gluconokinase [Sugiyamaella lignohabitans]|uniref:gluconokinase n=1 Tax=Sugiyamaella lignohabitans TaxID=796027 RepID=A0A167E9H2_9ASCO|nr:gluconokinase [Sugiyamaella lignohabitans]ANB13805.1 gluconokinase [Sugiyamaella lignohabitans]
MSNGIPLTDDDRWDWLADVAATSSRAAAGNESTYIAVAACSALTPKYREFLKSKVLPGTRIVIAFMWAPEEVLVARVGARKNHYMGTNMVASQAALMQVPKDEELLENGGFSIPMSTVDQDPTFIAGEVVKKVNAFLK